MDAEVSRTPLRMTRYDPEITESYDIMLNLLVYSLLAAVTGMAALYWLQRRRGDAGVVDVGWAGGIGLVAVAAAYSGDGWESRRLLLGLMGAVWAFRLTAYLVVDRLVRAEEEDGRYQMLRTQWGAKAQRYFFYLFQGQALLVVLFGLPFVAVAAKTHVGLDRLGCRRFAGVDGGRGRRRGWLTANWLPSAVKLLTTDAPATAGCGVIHAIPTTFLNGSTGGPTRSWRLGRQLVG